MKNIKKKEIERLTESINKNKENKSFDNNNHALYKNYRKKQQN